MSQGEEGGDEGDPQEGLRLALSRQCTTEDTALDCPVFAASDVGRTLPPRERTVTASSPSTCASGRAAPRSPRAHSRLLLRAASGAPAPTGFLCALLPIVAPTPRHGGEVWLPFPGRFGKRARCCQTHPKESPSKWGRPTPRNTSDTPLAKEIVRVRVQADCRAPGRQRSRSTV